MERASIAMEQKERIADELLKDLASETRERERLTNEKTELERRARGADADLKAIAGGNARAGKELERTERRTGKCTAEAKHVADIVPQLETELGQLGLDVKTETRVAAERSAAIEKIRADIDKEMKAYITEESAGKEKGRVRGGVRPGCQPGGYHQAPEEGGGGAEQGREGRADAS